MNDPLEIFIAALEEFNNHTKWDEARLGKIKTITNSSVGSVGQLFIEKLCETLAFECKFPLNIRGFRLSQSPWDIQINGIKYELKTATEDTNGKFQFNHIRYHREYEALLCLGVSPNNLYFGLWSKGEVATGKAGKLVSMEKNANASYKLTKSPQQLHCIEDFEREIKKFTVAFVK